MAIIFLWQRRGAGTCRALQWLAQEGRYVCGMTLRPGAYLRWLPGFIDTRAARWFAGRIAAGRGCDADLEVAGE